MSSGIFTTTRKVGQGLVFTQFCLLKGGFEVGAQEGDIRGICSAAARDRQQEVLIQEGMDWSYCDQAGVINEDHENGPGFVLGEPVSRWATTWFDERTGLEVPATGLEAFLYLEKSRARDAWETIRAQLSNPRSTRRVGFSVEGFATERDKADPKVVRRSRIVNVALTQHPIFPGARVEAIAKSAGAIGHQAPAGLGEGRYSALAPQDLDGAPADVREVADALSRSRAVAQITPSDLAARLMVYLPTLQKSQALNVARAVIRAARAIHKEPAA